MKISIEKLQILVYGILFFSISTNNIHSMNMNLDQQATEPASTNRFKIKLQKLGDFIKNSDDKEAIIAELKNYYNTFNKKTFDANARIYGPATYFNDYNYPRYSFLEEAIRFEAPDLVKELIDNGQVKLDQVNSKLHTTPLLQAIKQGSKEIVDILLKAGANIKVTDPLGNNALILAAQAPENSADLIKYFYEKGLNIESVNQQGTSPLAQALLSNNEEAAKTLLELGANPFQAYEYLQSQAARSQYSPSEYLYSSERYTEAQKNNSINNLIFNLYGNTDLVKRFLGLNEIKPASLIDSLNANQINEQTGENQVTPAHLAVYNSDVQGHDTLVALAAKNADFSIKDKNNLTPLQLAVKLSAPDYIINKILLAEYPYKKDDTIRALELARNQNNKRIGKQILDFINKLGAIQIIKEEEVPEEIVQEITSYL